MHSFNKHTNIFFIGIFTGLLLFSKLPFFLNTVTFWVALIAAASVFLMLLVKELSFKTVSIIAAGIASSYFAPTQLSPQATLDRVVTVSAFDNTLFHRNITSVKEIVSLSINVPASPAITGKPVAVVAQVLSTSNTKITLVRYSLACCTIDTEAFVVTAAAPDSTIPQAEDWVLVKGTLLWDNTEWIIVNAEFSKVDAPQEFYI